MRKINQAGIDLIKSFEGFRTDAYLDIVGVPTIGYGFTKGVKLGQTITQAEAEVRLKEELKTFESGISKLTAICNLTENQFAALVCFAYNVGLFAFEKSTMLKKLISGQNCSDEFLRWNKAGGKEVAGLTRRRKAERELFLK